MAMVWGLEEVVAMARQAMQRRGSPGRRRQSPGSPVRRARRRLTLAALALAGLGVAGRGDTAPAAAIPAVVAPAVADRAPAPRGGSSPGAAAAAALVAGNTVFALDLFGQLRRRPGNLFFSPYSLSNALAMVAAGARGATAREMGQVLHHPAGVAGAIGRLNAGLAERARADGQQLEVASALWPAVRFTLRPAYAMELERDFGATVSPLDFGADPETARRTINTWVERRTGDRIRDLIAPGAVSGATEMVLVNAITFKGDWDLPFDSTRTAPAPFRVGGRTPVPVPTMQRIGSYRLARVPGGRLLELPYAGDRLSLLILLPTRPTGLAELEGRLTPATLRGWLAALQNRTVEVALPRFGMAWASDDLNGALERMGLRTAFTAAADFGGIAAGSSPRLSGVVHKAWVEVNERGTEAAAATGLVMVTGMLDEPVETFRADHPFLFLLRDRVSGSLLFLGRLDDPAASGNSHDSSSPRGAPG